MRIESDTLTHIKTARLVTHACKFSTQEMETEPPEAHWPGSLVYLVSFNQMKDPILQLKADMI